MPHATRTFRVFASSTFSDLRAERDALQEHVFPALSRLCTEAGATFQPIDLRWGVSDEAGLDQQTMTICLTELERCQSTGVRPNFLILLGDRYGWLPLPPQILADEYRSVLAAVPDQAGRALLERWYGAEQERDDNAVPAVHRLKARDPHGEFADSAAWGGEEAAVRAVLLAALEKLDLPDGALVKYRASATEQEIIAGALDVPDAAGHVFCFARELSGLPDAVGPLPERDPARAYRNFHDDGTLDREAGQALASLKSRLRAKLGDHFVSYTAGWAAGGDGEAGPTTGHVGLLTPEADCDPAARHAGDAAGTLCRDVYDRLAGVIHAQLAAAGTLTAAELEAAAVAEFVEERTRFFTGRVSTLDRIRDYLTETGRQALALWGTSGSGKSTVLARAVQAAATAWHAGQVNVIAKFIGATGSNDGRAVLDDLSARIDELYGAGGSTGGRTYEDLVQQLPEKLALANTGKPLWVFLDALDQLSDANNARSLVWLPEKIPENVHIVVSTTPGECLANLQRKLDDDHVVELEPMPVGEGAQLLDKWLADAGRRLSGEQRDALLAAFAECPVPLYLRLAFEEARRWSSGAGVQPLAADTPGLIRQMFARLADPANHGPELVERVLGLLAASRYGLSEEELLGALAWDDDYWRQFVAEYAYHDLPQTMRGSERERWRRRIPVAVWSRLYYDLEPYLSEREVEGARLLAFYHRQLGEVAYLDYLADREASDDARATVADIETGLHAGTLPAGRVQAVPLAAAG
ncbi:MAG TPA: AAA family ATPase, partial [Thermoleophilia bacterium]|nr:AAA family ATPase [Thermoleophilia bacterium]